MTTDVAPQGAAAPQDSSVKREPTTQGKSKSRNQPAWVRDLPQWGAFRPDKPNPEYKLFKKDELDGLLKKYPTDVQQAVREDIAHMEKELMVLFRERDHTASINQNRYRKFQILYILLAAVATTVGSFQALALFSYTPMAPVWGFIETIIALIVTFLATLISRESPLQQWLDNRRRAEQMRREYFRYLCNLPPYHDLQKDDRRRSLARRVADINRGMDPDQVRSNT